MNIRKWNDVLDVDLPQVGPITQRTREITKRESYRFRGGVRVLSGRFWTDQEYEERRQNVLNTPLP